MKAKEPQECPQCRGTGWVCCPRVTCAHSCPCSLCAGTGKVMIVEMTLRGGTTAMVALPAGIISIEGVTSA